MSFHNRQFYPEAPYVPPTATTNSIYSSVWNSANQNPQVSKHVSPQHEHSHSGLPGSDEWTEIYEEE